MITLMLAAMIQQDKLAPVLARYEAAMRAMPCFEVKAAYKNPAASTIQADVVIDHNARLWYHATGKGADYTLSIDPTDGYREIDFYHRIYDQFSYRGDSRVANSRISGLFRTVPGWLHAPRLQDLLPKTTKFTYVGQATPSNGVLSDHLRAVIKDQMGTATLDISVMPSGLVSEYSTKVQSRMSGNSMAVWSLSDYKKVSSFPESKFANPIPDGFVPYALDQSDGPVMITTKPALGPWVDSKSGKQWSPMAGKTQLIVIAGPDSPPSNRAVAAVREWRGALAGSGVQLVVASDATSAARAKGLLFDPTQKNLKALQPPSTPLFVLVDASGRVTNLWLGFESANSAKLLADIQQAATPTK